MLSIVCSLMLIVIGATSHAHTYQKVVRVVDGDTITIAGDIKVRLIGVETPESKHPKKVAEYFSKEAAAFLYKLLQDQYVRLEAENRVLTAARAQACSEADFQSNLRENKTVREKGINNFDVLVLALGSGNYPS